MLRLPKPHLPGIRLPRIRSVIFLTPLIVIITIESLFLYQYYRQSLSQASDLASTRSYVSTFSSEISQLQSRILELESEDQRQKNIELFSTIDEIKKTYVKSVAVYEDLIDLKNPPAKLQGSYAEIVNLLSKTEYSSAEAKLTQLSKDISTEVQKQSAASAPAPDSVAAPANNNPPGTGYSRQTVSSDAGSFVVSIVSADLGSTRVIVDTASDSDCANNCPVLPLGTYVSRSGAFAGINGSYFCPTSYPSCVGKTNSFDLLLMNKNKTYFNSANNVYSGNPAVIFSPGSIRFVSAASQWGRDTGVDGVLSNYPLLVSGGNVVFGGNDDPKQGSKGNRSFVANKGNTVYIGVVHSATVSESARILKALSMENGLNLDNGGSTALWSGGYKVGPGRYLPNAILFVRR